MKAFIQDSETLRSLDPNQILVYLQEKGWEQDDYIEDKASMWTLKENGSEIAEILLPAHSRFRDFPLRISEILETLEEVEKRSQIEIFNNLVNSLSDVIRIKLNHQEFHNGTVPLNNGYNLIRYAREMMLSAACSTVDSRRHFEKKKPSEANEYLRKARFGQTEKGSFILTIISPISSEVIGHFSGDPFERKVIKTLFNSLELAKEAAQSIDVSRIDFELPSNYIEEGISSNLCDALVGIYQSGKREDIHIKLDSSPAISMPDSISTSINFPSKLMPAIHRIGKRLKANITPDFQVIGEVIKLERQNREQTGQVTLFGNLGKQIKKIKVQLSDEDYAIAAKAHQDRVFVSCFGSLIKEGQIYSLTNPKDFSIVNKVEE
ncbi:hypothetical protein [Altericista sp. CCNU0014]|uniref:hypothetical protein n=1 Tax=Altericista sp. CCNU0014 TaxID=3082949 RepID=UPI00384F3772